MSVIIYKKNLVFFWLGKPLDQGRHNTNTYHYYNTTCNYSTSTPTAFTSKISLGATRWELCPPGRSWGLVETAMWSWHSDSFGHGP